MESLDATGEGKEHFCGLTMRTELGDIELPSGVQPVQLDSEIVDEQLGNSRFYINKPALAPLLLQVDGTQLFQATGRLMVLTRVNNIHLPFFASSSGTEGKMLGAWHPFFGCARGWLVKGAKALPSDTNVIYHPEITHVQDVLNTNLIIDKNALNPDGKVTDEDGRVLFDLNKHLSYKNFAATNEAKEHDAEIREWEFVRQLTGYGPTDVSFWGKSFQQWIDAVVKQIR